MNSMSDRWTFTVNNPAGWTPEWDAGTMQYLVYQTERGAEGTEHIQGYVRFDTRRRGSTVKRALRCDRAHLEPARGTEQQNKDYCTKADTRVEGPAGEFGEFSADAGKQGKRSDLVLAAERIREGASMRDVALEFPATYIRYHGGFDAYRILAQPLPPVEREVDVLVLWGPTGTGKTHRIMTTFPECFCVRPGRDPWDGYSGQKEIFFDEFDYELWNIHEMKLILDKWRYVLQRRYRNAYAAWERVLICAQSSPNSWWPKAAEPDILAIRRRLAGKCRLCQDQNTHPSEMEINPVWDP